MEQVVLRGISWDFYGRLLTELGESSGTRIAYDNGSLQIVKISAERDHPNRTLASIVEIVAGEIGTDVCNMGSVTLQRPDLLKGFERFYFRYPFRYPDTMRDKDEIDLTVDPPPDLAIEVDVTSSSLNRFPIFAAVGVLEVWRYARGELAMYGLRDGTYHPLSTSLALPVLTPQPVTQFADSLRRIKWPAWVSLLREWARHATESIARRMVP